MLHRVEVDEYDTAFFSYGLCFDESIILEAYVEVGDVKSYNSFKCSYNVKEMRRGIPGYLGFSFILRERREGDRR